MTAVTLLPAIAGAPPTTSGNRRSDGAGSPFTTAFSHAGTALDAAIAPADPGPAAGRTGGKGAGVPSSGQSTSAADAATPIPVPPTMLVDPVPSPASGAATDPTSADEHAARTRSDADPVPAVVPSAPMTIAPATVIATPIAVPDAGPAIAEETGVTGPAAAVLGGPSPVTTPAPGAPPVRTPPVALAQAGAVSAPAETAGVPIGTPAAAPTASGPAVAGPPTSASAAATERPDAAGSGATTDVRLTVAVVAAPSTTAVAAEAPIAPDGPHPVAAQISPVVLNIVQRPWGSHQLTLTVHPDTLGPVTVRAHIGRDGDVRVELYGTSDAGRDALRTIVSELRRDLASVMPHASLSLGAGGSGQDTGRQTPLAFADGNGRRPAPEPAGRDDASAQPTAADAVRPFPSTAVPAVSGAGLDVFA
ncbi:hypothetical protein [Microbacterium capsulatum]|uniref:Flagellar hook-length control protein-like C-terminal domain-containing protein n=1 Tax=Microbacterium capsulatum TaxID=3041921 RepID=A0ABU0XE37_9MICO|nr:hypothetical protein [Microbacterium sp. ASV81]MDQ4213202.1 hypothetical protein [Microbacterium sp. ASV81]